jgi:hypothetical protein
MNKSGHLFVGFIVALITVMILNYFWGLFNLMDPYSILILVGITYIYSLLADIDHQNSTIVWTFLGLGIIGILIGYFTKFYLLFYLSIGLLVVTFLAARFLPHRGFTHSLLFGVIVSLPWLYYAPEVALLAFLTYYSHLAADEEWFKLY